MIILDHIQGSPEWHASRAGIPSASCFDKIITTSGKLSKERQGYLYELAGQRISGEVEEGYKNHHMVRGNRIEGEARDTLAFLLGEEIVQVGFCLADDMSYGASPDGMIVGRAGVEIKCKAFKAHYEMVKAGVLPTDHFTQIQGGLAVSDLEFWIFFAYFPKARPLVLKVKRNEAFITRLKTEIVMFNQELDAMVKEMSENT
jgi:hypothetical protein